MQLFLLICQESASAAIRSSLLQIATNKASPKNVFLLHGITGSGKTEVYLQALAEAVKLGKRGIALVPEDRNIIGGLTVEENLKLAQIALTMGANDMGGVLMEEVVVKATGIRTRTNTQELIDLIENAGKIPVQRDSQYRVIKEFK